MNLETHYFELTFLLKIYFFFFIQNMIKKFKNCFKLLKFTNRAPKITDKLYFWGSPGYEFFNIIFYAILQARETVSDLCTLVYIDRIIFLIWCPSPKLSFFFTLLYSIIFLFSDDIVSTMVHIDTICCFRFQYCNTSVLG